MIHLFATAITPTVSLSQEDEFHLFSVLRLNKLERFHIVFEGQVYLAYVDDLKRKHIVIEKKIELATESSFERILLLPLLKGDHLEWSLQKAVELGVTSIALYTSRWTIVDWDAKQLPTKMNRLRKIIREAAMQSQRLRIPTLLIPRPLKDLLSYFSFKEKWVALDSQRHLLPPLKPQIPSMTSIALLIGPEGGFHEEELKEMQRLDWHGYSLGSRVLRSETAVVASLAILEHEFQMGKRSNND